jgi:hypothetical protein
VLAIDLVPLFGAQQSVNAGNPVPIKERESRSTEVMLVLKEGDLVTVGRLNEIASKPPVQAGWPRSEQRRRAEQRIVKHDNLKSEIAKARRKPARGIDRPDRKGRVLRERVDMFENRRCRRVKGQVVKEKDAVYHWAAIHFLAVM